MCELKHTIITGLNTCCAGMKFSSFTVGAIYAAEPCVKFADISWSALLGLHFLGSHLQTPQLGSH
jgi:hypothetical protein